MSIAEKLNAGFLPSIPTGNPGMTEYNVTDLVKASVFTSPSLSSPIRITAVGWYCPSKGIGASYDVGIYSHDSTNNCPLTRLYQDAGATAVGWNTQVESWTVQSSTIYWLAVTDTGGIGGTSVDSTTNASYKEDFIPWTGSGLPSSWGTTSVSNQRITAIYARYSAPRNQGVVIA
jgi:hypothetical protein